MATTPVRWRLRRDGVSSNFVSADFGIITISSFQKLRISRFRKSKFSET